MTLIERLERIMKEMGWDRADLQRVAGVTSSAVSQWLGKGSKLIHTIGQMEAAERLAQATGYRALWIAKGVGPERPSDSPTDMGGKTQSIQLRRVADWQSRSGSKRQAVSLDDNPDLPVVPLVQFKLSAGASGFSVDYLEDEARPITFRRQWFQEKGYEPSELFAIKVMNGSMEPGLWDGDVVVVNTADTTPKDGAVFAVNYEGELVIKRLVRDEGRWWLKSDNPDQMRYPRKACDEGVFIIGRVVHKQSETI